MKIWKYFTIFILILHSIQFYAQERKKSAYPPSSIDVDHDCAWSNRFSLSDRLSNYPFNKTKSIAIISCADTLNILKPSEEIRLNAADIDSLTNILYNYDYKGKIEFLTETECFDPHHAILFLDEKGKIFDDIEICFLCSRIRSSSSKIITGNFCTGKYELLKKYFTGLGLTVDRER